MTLGTIPIICLTSVIGPHYITPIGSEGLPRSGFSLLIEGFLPRRASQPVDCEYEMIVYLTELDGVDWNEAAQVIHRAPLGSRARDPEQLKHAFEASYAMVFAFDSERLIGMARALCDGQYQAAVYDVVLLPEYQGRGIGKSMMRRLREQLPVENVILYAVPGKEAFYEKCGFKRLRTGMAILNPEASDPGRGILDP